MSLPEKLQQAIDFARQQVEADDHHSLLPKDRLPIYQAIEELGMPLSQQLNAQLALITAERFLPYWEATVPDNNFCQEVIQVTKDHRDGKSLEAFWEEYSDLQAAMAYYSGELTDQTARLVLKIVYIAYLTEMGHKPFSQISSEKYKLASLMRCYYSAVSVLMLLQ